MNAKRGIATILVTITLVSLFLLSGCNNNQQTNQGRSFIGGSEGLKIEFLDNAPPAEVFDFEYPFSISLKIENIGEWDINAPADATVRISGIDPKDFSRTSADFVKDVSTSLRGANRNPNGDIIRGTLTNVEFQKLQFATPVTTTVELPIRADVCYGYGTKVNTKICVLKDLLGSEARTEKENVCNPNEAKEAENSGAPVHITNFKQNVVASDKLTFSFTIQHSGKGIISKRASECSSTPANKDKVMVNINTGLDGLACSGIDGGGKTGETTLYDGVREIVCTQPLSTTQRGDYEKQISITLDYDYEDHVDTTITVKPSVR